MSMDQFFKKVHLFGYSSFAWAMKLGMLCLMACGFFLAPRIVLAEQELLPTRLTVDVSTLKKDALIKKSPQVVHDAIVRDSLQLFEREGLSLVKEEEDASIEVKLQWKNSSNFDYIVNIELRYKQQLVEPGIDPFECNECVDDTIIQAVLDQFPQAAKLLIKAREKERLHVATQNSTESNHIKNANPENQPSSCKDKKPSCPSHSKNYRPLNILGATLAGAGGGLVITGAILLSRKEVETLDPEDFSLLRVKSFKTSGIVLTSIGAGFAVTGASVLLVTHFQREKQSSKKLSVYPFFHPHALGLGLSSRF